MPAESIIIVTGNEKKAREMRYALSLILGRWARLAHPDIDFGSPVDLARLTEACRSLGHDMHEVGFVPADLPELQDGWEAIARAKAIAALEYVPGGTVIVEDVTFHLAALGPHSAPYIKFLLLDNSPADLYALAQLGVQRGRPDLAEERCTFALARPGDTAADVEIMSALVGGDVVPPVGQHGFGYDSIFRPHGKLETYAQMGSAKADVSARGCALLQLAARLWPQLDPGIVLPSEQ